MKQIILIITLLVLTAGRCFAQYDYDIISSGQGKDGAYFVKVTSHVRDKKDAEDTLKKCAVHGVMFKGIMSDKDGMPSQKPLIKDPNTEQTKAEFFKSFFETGQYARYVSLTKSSMTVMKESRRKYEVSALLLVDKEALIHYLEKTNIIIGFDNLW